MIFLMSELSIHDAFMFFELSFLGLVLNMFSYVNYAGLSKRLLTCETVLSGLFLLCIATTPQSHSLSLIIVLLISKLIHKFVPNWVYLILLLLANDIELNPGDIYHKSFFSFMNWNLNSIVKNNFERARLIEAHNSLHNYDLISLCETSLNPSVCIPDNLLDGYSFIAAHHPSNTSRGELVYFTKSLFQ